MKHSFWKLAAHATGWSYDPTEMGNLCREHLVAAIVVREHAISILVGHTDDVGDFYLLDSAREEMTFSGDGHARVQATKNALLTCWSRIGTRLSTSIGRVLLCLPAQGARRDQGRAVVKIPYQRFLPGFHSPRVRPYHVERVSAELLRDQVRKGRIPCDWVRREFRLSDGRETADPLRCQSGTLEARADMVTVDAELTDAILDQLNEMQVSPTAMASPFGAAAGMVTEQERRFGVAVLDVGDREMGCTIFSGDTVIATDVMSWNRDRVLHEVGRRMGVWPGHIEAFVREHGDRLRLSECGADTPFPLPSSAGARTVNVGDLLSAAEAPVGEWHTWAVGALAEAERQGVAVTKIVLIGDDFLCLSALRRLLAGDGRGRECEWRRLSVTHRPTELSDSDWARAIGMVRLLSAGRLSEQPYLRYGNATFFDRINRAVGHAPRRVGEWCIGTVRAAARRRWVRRPSKGVPLHDGLSLDRRATRGMIGRFTLY